jgi:transposase
LSAAKLVVLDETSTNLAMTSLYGWAPSKERAYGTAPRNYGQNVTLLGALSLEGFAPERPLVVTGAVDKPLFETYIRQVLAPTLHAGQIVLIDNLAAHKSEEVRQAIEARGCTLEYLPAYSPDFSPIEPGFSKLKQSLRRAAERSFEGLIEAIDQGLSAVTAQDVRGWFRHCGYVVPDQSFCNLL